MFQRHTRLSLPPLANSVPSGLTSSERIHPLWASMERIGVVVSPAVFHQVILPSQPPLMACEPSFENASEMTHVSCPPL
jgi:hypothetical protein